MAVDASRGSRRHEFDDTADDTPSTVDSQPRRGRSTSLGARTRSPWLAVTGRAYFSIGRSECVTPADTGPGLTYRRHDARLREGMRQASWILRSLPTSLATEPERPLGMIRIDARPCD
jgi:hypothetical protein